jgi:GT2 family glycosyltransferase
VIDVVVPFFNQSGKLRACLRSLDASVGPETRILLVDDASAPEESAAAQAIVAGMRRPVDLITHAENRGFRDSAMSGINASTGAYVILLNSDTIVTPGFAEHLVDVMRRAPDIAAVAPVSNANTDLFQHRPGFPSTPGEGGDLIKAVLAFAKARKLEHTGKVTEAPYLTGMCMALARDAAAAAGWLGTEYIHGYFEDLDLCCRLRAAGKRLAIREDCFVYHAGHASYAAADRAWLAPAMLNNYRLFCSRWDSLPEHDELLRRIRLAGESAPVGTQAEEAAHV